MSGAAGGAGGEAVVRGLMAVAQVRVGRILLWMIVALLGFMGVVSWGAGDQDYRGWLGLAFVLALFPIMGSIKARRERSPSPIKWLLPKVALALVGLGIAGLLYWLRSRGRKAEALPPPPRPEEIDQLALQELEAERAA